MSERVEHVSKTELIRHIRSEGRWLEEGLAQRTEENIDGKEQAA